MTNRFGRRYLSETEFLDYAKSLGLFAHQVTQGLLEFLERCEILSPIARVRFPADIVQRWHRDRYPTANVPEPVEPDTARFRAATDLRFEIFHNLWNNPAIYGERTHSLDCVAPEHAPFVQQEFDSDAFLPWSDSRSTIEIRGGNQIYDSWDSMRTLYHYWQVFALAAFARSGMTVLYDLKDELLSAEIWKLRIPETSQKSIFATINIDGRHELREILERRSLFDVVAYFEAYRHNAIQKRAADFDPVTGRLPPKLAEEYRSRCRDLAQEAAARFRVSSEQVLEFIRFQCDLWCTAKERDPHKLADEYKRNIDSTIDLYQRLSGDAFDVVTTKVGQAGGYMKPILRVIFPDWLEEHRSVAELSLTHWILPNTKALPAPFAVADQGVAEFCNWLEQHGLYQIYWHFRRLKDIGRDDHSIARNAMTLEVVGLANTIELIANAVIISRGGSPRGQTLAPKIRNIVSPHAPQLVALLEKYKGLTRTDTSTLASQMTQIDLVTDGGTSAPVLRALLKLIVIRNEGTHVGLGGLDRKDIYALLETLAVACLVIWSAR